MRGGIWPVVWGSPVTKKKVIQRALVRRAGREEPSLNVTPGFFDTVAHFRSCAAGTSANGRPTDAPFVAVVSRSFARERYWPDCEPAIGRRFTLRSPSARIVGVVGDIRVRGLERETRATGLSSRRAIPDGQLASTRRGSRHSCVGADRQRCCRRCGRSSRRDPEQPITESVRRRSSLETAPRVVQLRVLGAFRRVALPARRIGIHGLLAFTVAAARARSACASRSAPRHATSSGDGPRPQHHAGVPRRHPRGAMLAFAVGPLASRRCCSVSIRPTPTVFAAAIGLSLADDARRQPAARLARGARRSDRRHASIKFVHR